MLHELTLWKYAVLIIIICSGKPNTCTGRLDLTLEPVPNWPNTLEPKAHTLPAAVKTNEWAWPPLHAMHT